MAGRPDPAACGEAFTLIVKRLRADCVCATSEALPERWLELTRELEKQMHLASRRQENATDLKNRIG
jgi:hypothetical protein